MPLLGYYANSAYPVNMPRIAAYDQGLHCSVIEISIENTKNENVHHGTSKTRRGLIQIIRVDKSSLYTERNN